MNTEEKDLHENLDEIHSTQEEVTAQENSPNTENTEKSEEEEPSWEEKYHKTYDDYIRLFSEFDNFRKRTIKERIDLIKTAGTEIMSAILPVFDDFDRALKAIPAQPENQAILEGIQLIYNKFKNTLTEKGLQEMSPINEVFDAEIHEAVTNIPAPNEEAKGTIADVLEKGYKLHEKVIRYPKVVVFN